MMRLNSEGLELLVVYARFGRVIRYKQHGLLYSTNWRSRSTVYEKQHESH